MKVSLNCKTVMEKVYHMKKTQHYNCKHMKGKLKYDVN